ncbi:HNH nuclease, partial [Colletotrichum scovillei]
MDEIANHPDGDGDASSVIDSQLTLASSDPEHWAKKHYEVLEMLTNYTPLGTQDDTTQVLRLFADKLPLRGQLVLLSEIMCYRHSPVQLRQLRDFLVQAILIPQRRTEDDIVSSSSEADSPDSLLEQLESYVCDSKLRQDCLLRDGGQCVVTKYFDRGWVEENFSGQMMPQGRMSTLECVRIIPFLIGDSDKRTAKEARANAKTWWALWRYFPELEGKIGPDTINQTGNAFTINSEVHCDFGYFDFGFEQQHGSTTKYDIRWSCAWNPAYGLFKNYPESVEFTSKDPRVALPDPVFLDVHFRVGDILN